MLLLARIPQYPFPLLTAFSIVCLADNGRHKFVRNLFGAGSSNEGIGLFSFSTSWTLITQGYPLVWPLRTRMCSLTFVRYEVIDSLARIDSRDKFVQ